MIREPEKKKEQEKKRPVSRLSPWSSGYCHDQSAGHGLEGIPVIRAVCKPARGDDQRPPAVVRRCPQMSAGKLSPWS
jgi:hypothetical protein